MTGRRGRQLFWESAVAQSERFVIESGMIYKTSVNPSGKDDDPIRATTRAKVVLSALICGQFFIEHQEESHDGC
jgi:hypothetical protein